MNRTIPIPTPSLPRLAALLAVVPLLGSCAGRSIAQGPDPHSWSHPEQVRVRHLDLDLAVDFDARRLVGRASLELERKEPGAPLILDTRDLEIHEVTDGNGAALAHRLGPPRGSLGSALIVDLEPETGVVRIDYATAPGAAALQWLAPEQTAGGRQPFLYTQSQSILARSWIPCQDAPSVRMTYEATIRVPPPLLALMSAENPTEPAPDGVYHFRMPQPIPSYLLALAAGELSFRPLGPHSGVYAEPSVVERAAWEFAETEEMMRVAESLYGPYRWGRYDVLVLPPSFPFGGMENPRLTFATPTVLAGDRSLAALVAHELAHSWSGNLVTNATWNDFWLNEGFTTYIELRIMEALRGRDYADMLRLLGRQSLEEEMTRLGRDGPDTRLAVDLAGRDPDEGMTDVPYEKGRLLLEMLERHFGRERWDGFLRRYFEHFAFTPVTSEDFVRFLAGELAAGDPELLERVDLWIHGTGLPNDVPPPKPVAFEQVERALEAWRSGAPAASLDTRAWSIHRWLHFLRQLEDPIPPERMRELDEAFRLTATENAEILDAWLLHAIRSGYRPADARLESFLTGVGRLKFLEPLYRALAQTEEGRERAREIFQRARGRYHPITVERVRRVLEKDLG